MTESHIAGFATAKRIVPPVKPFAVLLLDEDDAMDWVGFVSAGELDVFGLPARAGDGRLGRRRDRDQRVGDGDPHLAEHPCSSVGAESTALSVVRVSR